MTIDRLRRGLADLNSGLAEGAAIVLRTLVSVAILIFVAAVYGLIGLVIMAVLGALIWLLIQVVWAAAYVAIAVLVVFVVMTIFGAAR